MAGVGQQGERIGEEAVGRLGGDEAAVEHDADQEGTAKGGGSMRVTVLAVAVVVIVICRMMIVVHGPKLSQPYTPII